jgi:adenylate cyclase class 2
MSTTDQEIEAKFYVLDLPAVEARLRALGARLVTPRIHEQNLRFDSRGGRLTRERLVLRLRQDQNAVLTFKGPARPGQSVVTRQEIEVQVSDFAAMRRILEALGYRVSVMYEKYRATYQWEAVEVVLDELPYGNFVEIEGPDAETIRRTAEQLRLDWSARSVDSYLGLFERLKLSYGLTARHLSFAEFKGETVNAHDLGLDPADAPR